MLIKKSEGIRSSEITGQKLYFDRRKFLAGAATLAGAVAVGGVGCVSAAAPAPTQGGRKLPGVVKGQFSTDEKQTPYKDITNYNNFYEFATDKYSPADLAKNFRTRPWTVKVEGLVQKPKTFDIDSLLKLATLEDRVYRHRCVEGWSMVIPWVGYSFSKLVSQVQPLGSAKYVEFTTLDDPAQMPGVRYRVLDWPYTEGLRLDEANHPLTLLVFGLYGEVLPNQDGAPMRIARALEVRIQELQVHRAHPLHRQAARDRMEQVRAQRVRLLLERQSERGPSALEPGERAPHRRVL